MANKSKQIVWGVRKEGRSLWTRNAVKGISVRGEKRKRDGRIEWRRWDPTRSKVAAAILRTRVEPSSLLPTPGSTCLYLGASSGGTVSHIHDFVCGADNHHGGQLVAVEISPRMVRDLVKLSDSRPGLVPVLGDARKPEQVAPFIREKASWIHQDLSIADQAETFVKMATSFLAPDGIGLLSLKAASERSSEGDDNSRFQKAEQILRDSDLVFQERMDLKGLEEQHVVFSCTLG
ncbi:MAG: fibrillarin-like rRNA/tRNA 2'-O-methyltransferase, partial [Candidatus Thalassarchaeaceae archaeon]|nr:fibrillarin-like rRNA/tRNA 2'-O-methyltransferase [Candidatus Thalassarchaeaceae archaeon]